MTEIVTAVSNSLTLSEALDTSIATVPTKHSSQDLLGYINQVRAEFGETEIRHNVLLARVKDELDGDEYETYVEPAKTTATGHTPAFEAAILSVDQCKLVAMRESKGVRRKVLAKLNQLGAQLVQALQANLQLEQERNTALELYAKVQQLRADESEAEKEKGTKLLLAIQKKDLGAYAHDMAVAGAVSLHKSGWDNQEMLRQALCGAFVKHNETVKLAEQLNKHLPYELRVKIEDYKERTFKLLKPTTPDLFLDSFKKVEILDYVEEGRKWMRANGREPAPLLNSLVEIASYYQRRVK